MKERIKKIRKYFGLTQEQFAKRIGKTTGFISSVESGRCNMSQDTINRIVKQFNINKQWFINGIGEMFNGEVIPSVDIENIGNRIKTIRLKEGLTQQEFGDSIGYHKNQIYYVEKGKIIPSNEFLNAVVDCFKLNLDWLITGKGEMYLSLDSYKVNDELIDWLNRHPEIVKELMVRSKLEDDD